MENNTETDDYEQRLHEQKNLQDYKFNRKMTNENPKEETKT
jgi:hypothetical protein